MATLCPRRHYFQPLFPLLILLVLQLFPHITVSNSVVKFLPGFDGPLPFHLETGYVGVGESEDIQLFYYFIKSQGKPEKDPVLLWLTGGPGCSAFSALVYEIGPLHFNIVEYNGSLPTLVLHPHSWTKVSSIIFVDSPVGTGFSYANSPAASQSSDTKQIQHICEFFRKWLIRHPEFLTNAVYVGGDSYAGIIVPGVFQEILNGNDGNKPAINLQGYILGNAITEYHLETNSRIPFAHGMGLISDELYKALKRSCKGEYQNIDPSNTNCLKDMQLFQKCTSGIEFAHILVPKCVLVAPQPPKMSSERRSLYKKPYSVLKDDPALPEFGCPTYAYLLSRYWANDDGVQEALHIRKGSIGQWQRCNLDSPYYSSDLTSSFQYHVNLSTKGYRSIVYSGDHDMIVPFLGTQAWIRNLNYSIVEDWRPWMVQGQIAGYTRTYSNRMTFATVKGGGHVAPEYKPKECFAMFKRWINYETL